MQLAEELGISRKMVDYYERRATNPSTEFVRKAADVLQVAVSELLEDVSADQGAPRRRKPGPKSALERRIEELRKLPPREQEVIVRMLDGALSQR